MERTEIVSVFQKKIFGLALTIGAASFIMAQQKVNISGNVKDANGGVGYASITFKNQQNSQLSDAALADVDGNYKIDLAPGNYDVSIEAVDYKKFTKTIRVEKAGAISPFVIVSDGKANLNNTTDIQGVVITATSTKPYKVELDKKTYDPSQDIVSKGGSLQDVLTNVPSVSVDTDGTVSMRGSSNVRFLINGKPSALLGIDDGANALQSIPADQIEKIEVITNPSSKFEASGTAGILNIILKKNKKTGFNGSVIGTLGYLPQTNLNTSLSWRKGNFSWFLNGGGGYRESKNTNRIDTYYQNVTTDGNQTESHQNSITKSKNSNYNATAGIVYDINEKTSVNASGTVRTFESDNIGNVNYTYQYLNAINTYKLRANDGTNNNLAFQGDLGLDHKFDDKGQNLSLSLSLQRNRSNNDTDINEYENNIPDPNFLSLTNIINQKTVNKNIVAKADYELPVGEISKLEAGYRLDSNHNQYDNNVLESIDNAPLSYVEGFTYNADYKELFNAFYIQFKSKIGKVGYQLGLRDEISNVTVDYHNLVTDIDSPYYNPIDNKKKSYNNLFPTVFLSYEFTKDNLLLLNYTRRIDRPRGFFMIPNPNYNDNQNIFDGNIDLNPSYVDSYEVGYSISKKKFTINPTLYYRHQADDVKMLVYNRYDINRDLIIFHTKPINLGTDDKYGLDLNFNWDATSWLKFMGNLDLFGYNTKGSTLYETTDLQGNKITDIANFNGTGFSTRSRLTSTFKIDKTLNLQVQGFYRGGQKTQFENRKEMYAVNFGASKTIWSGNGIIAFNIQDVFNTRAMQRTNYTANSIRDSYMQWQPRQFALSFTYKFKQGEKVEQPKRKKDINANDNGGDEQGPM
ncbi:outer membrane receptor protein involved in Fe transport [Epilithonimonas hungarica]|uniref:TonB-dependent receptor domain-containing protein n=1 Tax=Epilithonimonas hungarica TaxID=454006 RepID=UPI0027846907|nr:TonB-dependent receptor [Epilithonimonas hungarica]MDP9954387.1 outer membrane receptor protein involved in Fe transport [Epilithonimonas hungarica]